MFDDKRIVSSEETEPLKGKTRYALVPENEEKEEKIICEVCGYANPKYTAICKKCSNYLTK